MQSISKNIPDHNTIDDAQPLRIRVAAAPLRTDDAVVAAILAHTTANGNVDLRALDPAMAAQLMDDSPAMIDQQFREHWKAGHGIKSLTLQLTPHEWMNSRNAGKTVAPWTNGCPDLEPIVVHPPAPNGPDDICIVDLRSLPPTATKLTFSPRRNLTILLWDSQKLDFSFITRPEEEDAGTISVLRIASQQAISSVPTENRTLSPSTLHNVVNVGVMSYLSRGDIERLCRTSKAAGELLLETPMLRPRTADQLNALLDRAKRAGRGIVGLDLSGIEGASGEFHSCHAAQLKHVAEVAPTLKKLVGLQLANMDGASCLSRLQDLEELEIWPLSNFEMPDLDPSKLSKLKSLGFRSYANQSLSGMGRLQGLELTRLCVDFRNDLRSPQELPRSLRCLSLTTIFPLGSYGCLPDLDDLYLSSYDWANFDLANPPGTLRTLSLALHGRQMSLDGLGAATGLKMLSLHMRLPLPNVAQALAELPEGLQVLSLANFNIEERHLPLLERLTQLHQLDLPYALYAAAVARFRVTMPGVRIGSIYIHQRPWSFREYRPPQP